MTRSRSVNYKFRKVSTHFGWDIWVTGIPSFLRFLWITREAYVLIDDVGGVAKPHTIAWTCLNNDPSAIGAGSV